MKDDRALAVSNATAVAEALVALLTGKTRRFVRTYAVSGLRTELSMRFVLIHGAWHYGELWAPRAHLEVALASSGLSARKVATRYS